MSKQNAAGAAPQENKMGVLPVGKLLAGMAVPMMISMLVQALYNIVDSVFVSRLSENAFNAVGLAFPLQSLMIAVAVGTAVGINAFLSKTLGEKDFEKADIIAQNGIFLAIASYVAFAVIGLLVSRPFFASQTEVLEVREYGVTYLTICCVAGMGIFLQTTFERLLQATGKTFYTMITQGTGAVINIILDPILIFGYFGMPRMGIAGAAVATVIGQIIAAILALVFNLKCNRELNISMKGFRPNGHLIVQIYKVGAPSIVVQAIGSLMTYGMNLILAAFGSAQTVFGIYFKLQSFVFMPVFGLNNGMVPIIAYNYGAGHKDRVIKTIKHSVAYGVGIMFVGLLAMHIFPAQLMRMFDAEESLIAIGAPALETISLSFVFAGFCIVAGSVFQALGNGVYSMIVSVARQMCVLLPVAKLLSLSGEVTLIWWAFPIAELASVLLTSYFLVRIYRKVICHIGEPVVQDA
jgi:putative MATE family efflux protein